MKQRIPLDDQARQYVNASPDALLEQLNGLGTSVRVRDKIIADRELVIHELHGSIAARDKTIRLLNGKLKYTRVKLALLFALIGGAAAKGAEALVVALVHFGIQWLRHHS
jgi:hypothetical protein